MATSSTKKLTKYTSGSTIVTADTANAWYGGLYGSYEGTLLDADDPRVIGHVHDGEPYDGHSSKVNLVNHVTDKLQHQNLADEAVWKNNVASFLDQTQAIPESYTVGLDKYYFLDLRDVYSYVDDEIAGVDTPFETADTNLDLTDDAVRQSDTNYGSTGMDFVYGSSKLDDMSDGTNGDERLIFDKSKGSFRAGSVNSNQWDNANRGNYSSALGRNTTASGVSSFAAGSGNIASGDNSFVGGETNTVSGKNSTAFGSTNIVVGLANFVSGEVNTITTGDGNAIFGTQNNISSSDSVIGGIQNTVGGNYGLVVGYLHDVTGNGSLVCGNTNYSRGNYNATFGVGNLTRNDGAITSDSRGSLVSGTANESKSRASILAGDQNLTYLGSNYCAIFGQSNESRSSGTLMAGFDNTVFASSSGSAIVGTLNATNAPNSFVSGREVVAKVEGEISHGSGKFTIVGDAQSNRYVVRGSLANPIVAPGLILSVDGAGLNYQMDLNSAYHVSVMLVGKLAGPATQQAGAYKLESLALGPTPVPLAGSISAPIITYISRTPYFAAPTVNVTLTVNPITNRIQVNVSDTTANFLPSRWVATVTLTVCRF